ncbi:MAG: hypothetical protein KDD70_10325, partial [Bdellovibrionales bacterium]|nr:hypothetical protein [Bdellovibrionales bacterium]
MKGSTLLFAITSLFCFSSSALAQTNPGQATTYLIKQDTTNQDSFFNAEVVVTKGLNGSIERVYAAPEATALGTKGRLTRVTAFEVGLTQNTSSTAAPFPSFNEMAPGIGSSGYAMAVVDPAASVSRIGVGSHLLNRVDINEAWKVGNTGAGGNFWGSSSACTHQITDAGVNLKVTTTAGYGIAQDFGKQGTTIYSFTGVDNGEALANSSLCPTGNNCTKGGAVVIRNMGNGLTCSNPVVKTILNPNPNDFNAKFGKHILVDDFDFDGNLDLVASAENAVNGAGLVYLFLDVLATGPAANVPDDTLHGWDFTALTPQAPTSPRVISNEVFGTALTKLVRPSDGLALIGVGAPGEDSNKGAGYIFSVENWTDPQNFPRKARPRNKIVSGYAGARNGTSISLGYYGSVPGSEEVDVVLGSPSQSSGVVANFVVADKTGPGLFRYRDISNFAIRFLAHYGNSTILPGQGIGKFLTT